MSTVWVAMVDEWEGSKTQVCATREDAVHWMAMVAIPEQGWLDFWDQVTTREEVSVPRERALSDPEAVLAFYVGEKAAGVDEWGVGLEFQARIEAQEIYTRQEAS